MFFQKSSKHPNIIKSDFFRQKKLNIDFYHLLTNRMFILNQNVIFFYIQYFVKMGQSYADIKNSIYNKMRQLKTGEAQRRSFYQNLEHGSQEQTMKMADQIVPKTKLQEIKPLIKKLQEKHDKLQEEKNELVENSKGLREQKNEIDRYLLKTQESITVQKLTGETRIALVIGIPGIDKTPFLNALANCIMGVQTEDLFRYFIVDGVEVQPGNAEITTYIIKKQEKMRSNFILVDVPCIGDGISVEADNEKLQKFKNTLKNSIPQINLVFFLCNRSHNHITTKEYYAINRTLGMFASDVSSNFYFVFNMADVHAHPFDKVLKITFKEFLNGLRFNSALEFDPSSIQIFRQAYDLLLQSSSVSTKGTVTVIQRIEQIEGNLRVLNNQMNEFIDYKMQINQAVIALTNAQTNIYEKNVEKKPKDKKRRQVQVNYPSINCKLCLYTCHRECSYLDKDDIKKCCVFNQADICIMCPGRCSSASHASQRMNYQDYEEDDQYQLALRQKEHIQTLLIEVLFRFFEAFEETNKTIRNLKLAHEELNELKLYKVEQQSIINYFQLLIDAAKRKKESPKRIEQLERMKKFQKKKQKLFEIEQRQQKEGFIEQCLTKTIQDKEARKRVLEAVEKKLNQAHHVIL